MTFGYGDMELLRKAAVLCFAVSLVSASVVLASNVSGTSSGHQDPANEHSANFNQTASRDAEISRAGQLRPPPARAKFDKGHAHANGCGTPRRDAKVVTCRYGKRNAPTTVALFGDSHALQYSPTLATLAQRRNIQVVTFLRGSCVIADVNYEGRCNRWRNNAIRRIQNLKPDVIAVSSATGNSYVVKRGGNTLNRQNSEKFLRSGMARTLRKLVNTGNGKGGKARVVLLRDQALAPFRPPDCLRNNANRPGRCAFRTNRPNPPGFDWAGAKRVERVRIINPMSYFCGKDWCPAVSGNIVVFRDKYHITATYARTMTQWLARRLGI